MPTTQHLPMSVLDNVEAERQRIARDLHDSIGSMLASVLLLFDSVEANNTERFLRVKSMLQETQREVRRIAHNITPACLQKLGLVAALEQYGDEISQSGQLYIYVSFSNRTHFKQIDSSLQVNIFRIVQEIIQNTIKHAQATQLDLVLCVHEGTVTLLTQDNGIGGERVNSPKSLKSLRERIKLLGGKIRVKSSEQAGTEIKIVLV